MDAVGGHLEPGDATLLDAAVRETIEESGPHRFDGPPRLLGVGRFDDVPCQPGQLRTHYDIRFLVLADHVDAVISEESLDLAGAPRAAAGTPRRADLRRLADQALAALDA